MKYNSKTTIITSVISFLLLLIAVQTVGALTAKSASLQEEDILIYGSNSYGNLEMIEINLSQNSFQQVGSAAVPNQAMAQDPETNFIYYYEWRSRGDEFYYFDPATQTNHLVRRFSPRPGFYAKRMDFAPDGTLYMMDNKDRLYTMDKLNGDYAYLGNVSGMVTGEYTGTGDMAFAPDGTLYVGTYENIYTVDIATLTATLLFADMFNQPSGEIAVWTGLAFCNGTIYGSSGEDRTGASGIYEIDLVSGDMSLLMDINVILNDITSCDTTSATPPTATFTPMPATATNTSTPTPTPTNTIMPPTPTLTPTLLPTNTSVPPTMTATATMTPTNTSMPATTTFTPTPEPTNTDTPPTATATATDIPTNTPVAPTATNTPTPTATNTLPTATFTPTPTPTEGPSNLSIFGSSSYGALEIVEIDLVQENYAVVGNAQRASQAIAQDPITEYIYYFEWKTSGNEFIYWDPATQTNHTVRIYSPAPRIYAKRMDFAPDGTLYMMDNAEKLYSIDEQTGTYNLIGTVTGLTTGPYGATGDMAFAPDGTLYVSTYENIYIVDLDTMTATLLFDDMFDQPSGEIAIWTGLAYCDGVLYGAHAESPSNLSAIFKINPETGYNDRIIDLNIVVNDLTSCYP